MTEDIFSSKKRTPMYRRSEKKVTGSGLGLFINRVQTLFVSLLRIWTIPIVLLLSLASGFTTYYGMSHFILPWIALIITVAIQSIIVICSLEIASIHWTANRFRYFSILASLLIALTASISFSYFKFYEFSERETIHIGRLNQIHHQIDSYLEKLVKVKTRILAQQGAELDKSAKDVSSAYFGTHQEIPPHRKNMVGKGPFWRHYNEIYLENKQQFTQLETSFSTVDEKIRTLKINLARLDIDAPDIEEIYQTILSNVQDVQISFNHLATSLGQSTPTPPKLMPYIQFVQGVKPSFSMWAGFSLFAFACAAMVDFFTVLLSYRLEFTAPGPLSSREEELVFECLKQFTEFRINENDELEMVIEKTEIERARRYSDWSRMFAVGFLLSRGFLRKIDSRTVEFAPNLYPMIADRMGDKLQALKAQARSIARDTEKQVIHELR